jgi:hypothetical protein
LHIHHFIYAEFVFSKSVFVRKKQLDIHTFECHHYVYYRARHLQETAKMHAELSHGDESQVELNWIETVVEGEPGAPAELGPFVLEVYEG